MPIARRKGAMILRIEDIGPEVMKRMTFLPELIPDDITMYLLLTDQLKPFVMKHRDEILSQLKEKELYYAPHQ